MTNPHKEAYLARRANGPAMSDANIETAGIPDLDLDLDSLVQSWDAAERSDEALPDLEETKEIESDPDTLAAIAEGEDDLANGELSDLEDGGESPSPDTSSKPSEVRKKTRSR